MADETPNLILEQLRLMRNEQQTRHAEITQQLTDVRARLRGLEEHLLALRRDVIGDAETIARQQVNLDQLVDRIHRIERRLNLTDPQGH